MPFFPSFPQVRAVENKMDFPTKHDWDSFFRDAKDMNETLPGERPDTIHLEGLPCRWFSQKDSLYPDRPSEEVLIIVFQTFGKVFHFFVSPFLCVNSRLRFKKTISHEAIRNKNNSSSATFWIVGAKCRHPHAGSIQGGDAGQELQYI